MYAFNCLVQRVLDKSLLAFVITDWSRPICFTVQVVHRNTRLPTADHRRLLADGLAGELWYHCYRYEACRTWQSTPVLSISFLCSLLFGQFYRSRSVLESALLYLVYFFVFRTFLFLNKQESMYVDAKHLMLWTRLNNGVGLVCSRLCLNCRL